MTESQTEKNERIIKDYIDCLEAAQKLIKEQKLAAIAHNIRVMIASLLYSAGYRKEGANETN